MAAKDSASINRKWERCDQETPKDGESGRLAESNGCEKKSDKDGGKLKEERQRREENAKEGKGEKREKAENPNKISDEVKKRAARRPA
jgi:hypothetical protein